MFAAAVAMGNLDGDSDLEIAIVSNDSTVDVLIHKLVYDPHR